MSSLSRLKLIKELLQLEQNRKLMKWTMVLKLLMKIMNNLKLLLLRCKLNLKMVKRISLELLRFQTWTQKNLKMQVKLLKGPQKVSVLLVQFPLNAGISEHY